MGRAQHRVPGEHGTPTLTRTERDPRLLAGFSLPTTPPELRELISQFQADRRIKAACGSVAPVELRLSHSDPILAGRRAAGIAHRPREI